MTVAELVEALKAMPQDLQVFTPDNGDFARVSRVAVVKISAQGVPGHSSAGEGRAVALNFDPADLG